MSFVSEIRKKSQHTEAPNLAITKHDQETLEKGHSVTIIDSSTGSTYSVRIKDDCINKYSLTKEDLEIAKISSPTGALMKTNKHYCHKCKEEVAVIKKLWNLICSKCRVILD